jgi:nucleotide-binding universal stress UspA family protein
MFRVLVPIDGSDNALRALQRAITVARDREPFELHLINVQPPLGGGVTTFVGTAAVKDYQREEGEKAMASARALLEREGIPFTAHITVGPLGQSIAGFARQLGCEAIIMGTRGMGKITGALLGSVSTDVIQHAEVPVTLVK